MDLNKETNEVEIKLRALTNKGKQLKSKMSHHQLEPLCGEDSADILQLESRYFHGIMIAISNPNERKYFILDSKVGLLNVFDRITQDTPSYGIVVC